MPSHRTPYRFWHRGRVLTVWAYTEREAFCLYREEVSA